MVKCNKLLKAGGGNCVGSGNTMCTSKRSTNDTRDIYMLEPRNRSKSHAKTKPILFRLVNCNYFFMQQIRYIQKNTLMKAQKDWSFGWASLKSSING